MRAQWLQRMQLLWWLVHIMWRYFTTLLCFVVLHVMKWVERRRVRSGENRKKMNSALHQWRNITLWTITQRAGLRTPGSALPLHCISFVYVHQNTPSSFFLMGLVPKKSFLMEITILKMTSLAVVQDSRRFIHYCTSEPLQHCSVQATLV